MKQKKRIVLVLCALVLVLAVFAVFYQKKTQTEKEEAKPVTAQGFQLNTIVTVTLYDSADEELAQEALALCGKYEKLFSRTSASSELYQLNHGELPEENGWYSVSKETAELIEEGLAYSALSKGAFDVTIEPVSSLWDFTSEEKVIPTDEALQEALPLVDYTQVSVQGQKVRFLQEGMGLDLGAVAKGYIADRIKDFLLENGVKSAIINLGGNVLCIGGRTDGTPFRVGIQMPFAERSQLLCAVDLSDKSVVSSGIYERYFEQDGKFYHHILNPANGQPYDNGLLSVSIISDTSIEGDGLSTVCFTLGLEKGLELINSMEDVEAIFVTEDFELHYSDGFEEQVILTEN